MSEFVASNGFYGETNNVMRVTSFSAQERESFDGARLNRVNQFKSGSTVDYIQHLQRVRNPNIIGKISIRTIGGYNPKNNNRTYPIDHNSGNNRV
jgi:hypothetical protein